MYNGAFSLGATLYSANVAYVAYAPLWGWPANGRPAHQTWLPLCIGGLRRAYPVSALVPPPPRGGG